MTRPQATRLAAYLLVVVMGSFGLWRIEQVRLIDRAHDCVADWAFHADLRNMSEKVYRRNADTLIAQFPNASDGRIIAYREQVELDVAEIRAELPDPPCDLEAAKDRIH